MENLLNDVARVQEKVIIAGKTNLKSLGEMVVFFSDEWMALPRENKVLAITMYICLSVDLILQQRVQKCLSNWATSVRVNN